MSLTLEVATIVVGALVLAALVPRVATRRRARRTRRPAPRPAALERIERVVGAGRQTAGDVHVRVRPLLREIAVPLVRRQGIRLDSEPERGRALLGEELWEVVRPDRPRPQERRAPGLGLSELERLIERLERL
ncbi:MAG: hypothetical protein ACTHQQ_19830 [Solirubrobacteraceae bacterium]